MQNSRIVKNLVGDLLSKEKIEEAIYNSKVEGKNLENYLFDKKIITPAMYYERLANYNKIPYIDLKNTNIKSEVLNLIPEPIASTHKIIAYDEDNKKVKVATLDPNNLEIFEFLKKKINKDLAVSLSSPDSINEVLKQYHKSLKSEIYTLKITGNINFDNNRNLKEIAEDLPIVKIVDTLLEYAIFEGSSDIHVEPEEKYLVVRYRTDGILHNVMTMPKNFQPGIIARIKILANLKVDEHRLPQDGRIKISNDQFNVSFRVSTIPTYDGEKIVMRILNEKAQVLSLEQLGLQPSALEKLKNNITRPHGMILVTGPTGSGKTTTLYTVLNILNKPEVNISTIEDPIEYRMPHINQSQVNPKIGYTFALGLRAFLRQDPDIIMVGEIRDEETAEIAVHAAMTGHLVLSTLHTNDAVGTLPRIIEMGIASYLVSSTVNIIMAQRLVRKICTNCIQSYKLSKEVLNELSKQFNIESIMKTMQKEKIIYDAKKGLENLLFYRGKGCKQCNNSGYKGRIGIYETLEISEKISNLIITKAEVSEIKKQAISEGMITIVEDGFMKAKNGITTIEEVMRVTKE